MFEVPDRLVRAGKFAGAVNARTFGAAGDDFAHHVGVQRTRALCREFVRLGPARTLVLDNAEHLRMTSPARWICTVSPLRTSSRAISPALCSVAFCTTTPPTVTGSSLATGVSKGAADLDFDVLDDGGGFFGREFMCDRPARRPRYEAEPLLPVEAVDLVDDAVDIVVEAGTSRFDVAVELQ